nr:ATP-binding cassette domain-containing protein [Microbacterium paludicola]
MTATLVAQGLAGGYGHRTLFDGVDLTVSPGDVVGVVGANGAGKSTLTRILSGPTPHPANLQPQPGANGCCAQTECVTASEREVRCVEERCPLSRYRPLDSR